MKYITTKIKINGMYCIRRDLGGGVSCAGLLESDATVVVVMVSSAVTGSPVIVEGASLLPACANIHTLFIFVFLIMIDYLIIRKMLDYQ